jgi:hypothetical protein
MTVIDVPAKKYKNIKNIKIIIFWGSGSLNPAELHGVKRAGHSQFTVAVSALLYPQVHELLIRCSMCPHSL